MKEQTISRYNPRIRTEMIEVEVVNTAGAEISLGILLNMRDAIGIRKIEAFHTGQVAKSPKGKAVVTLAALSVSSLKLIDRQNREYLHKSLSSFSKLSNGSTIDEINVPQIDTEKSKVIVGDTSQLVANTVFLFEITYELGYGQ